MKRIIFILIHLTYSFTTGFTQVIPQDPALIRIRDKVNQMISDSIIPSMAIAVIKDGKIIWEEAIGYADVETKRKATLQSVYPLGSVSKSITATGMMHMINAGEIGLFENIQKLIFPVQLKDINGASPDIKLWQLLSQNGGLNHGYGIFNKETLPKTPDQIRQFYEYSTIVAFTPGGFYHYSNHSFDVAELVIEKKSGESFQDYMDKNIFYPLSMKNSFAYPQLSDTVPMVSTYSANMKKLPSTDIIYPAGGSGFWSSIQDMSQYAMFHLGVIKNAEIISTGNLKLMHEFRQGPADMFGIGWFNSDGNLYSNGNVSGGNAVVSIDEKNNLAVICLLNRTSNDGMADQVAGDINDVFIKKNDDSYKSYRRIYATPYTMRFDLLGKWMGIIKDPVSQKEVPINLVFDDKGEILFNTGQQFVPLQYPVYNLMQELKGKFKITLPGIFDETLECSMTLSRNKDQFTGYLFYPRTMEKSFYTIPLFVKIEKTKSN